MRQLGLPPLAALAASCALIAGCGGGQDDTTEAKQIVVRPGSPEEVATTLAEVIPNAVTKKDCKEVAEINLRSNTKYLCPVTYGDPASMRRFELTDSAHFGARAVLDYRSKGTPNGATMTLFRDSDGEWAVSRAGLLPRSAASSPDADRKERDAVVDRYLTAVRERDCDTWVLNTATTRTDSTLACREEFPQTRALAAALEASPDVEPRYVGGNGSFGFYDLDLERPSTRRYSLGVFETPRGSLRPYVVLDFVVVSTQ